MRKIAISYRRTESDVTGRIFDRLVQRYGKQSVFRDIDSIPFGIDFRKVVDDALQDADVLIAIVGPTWRGDGGRGDARIDEHNDLVRIEIETALQRNIPVIPVLVGGALMPKATELPESLRDFSFRHAANIDSGLNFDPDIERVMRSVDRLLDSKNARPRNSAFWYSQPHKAWYSSKRALLIGATVAIAVGLIGIASRYEWSPVAPSPPQPKASSQLTAEWMPLSPDRERTLRARDRFKECDKCPEMVVAPAGSFTMGSSANEPGRVDNEGPQHRVTIATPFAIGRFHVTVDQFEAFVTQTGYNAGSQCFTWGIGKAEEQGAGRSWRDPGFPQLGSHPVVCLNWTDAKAYVEWLARNTGKVYRLLTEAEWEYAARAGTTTRYSFGDDEKDLCRYANGADQTANRDRVLSESLALAKRAVAPCSDGYVYTAPVGSFAANAFGLYDVHGNALQWLEDCWHENYQGAPSDGSAWTWGDCAGHVLRGGSWIDCPACQRSATRVWNANGRNNHFGFRVARTL
jgi:formylglycine-generating enzyme required for sulfatase activity